MDGSGWNGSPLWSSSSQQHDGIEEGFMVSNSNCLGKMTLPEDLFYPIPDQLPKLPHPSHPNPNSNSSRATHMLPPAMDSMNSNVISNSNFLEQHEAAMGLNGNAAVVLAKSGGGSGTSWVEPLDSALCSPTLGTKLPHIINVNPLGTSLMADFGDGVSLTTGSLESLDCLLSASNSKADGPVEDIGISMLFSDSKSMWNFGNSVGGVSSGESASNGSKDRDRDKRCGRVDEVDETVFHSSPDHQYHHVQAQQSRSSHPKPSPNPIKGNIDDHHQRHHNQVTNKPDGNYGYFDLIQPDASTTEGGFKLISRSLNPPKTKKPRSEKSPISSNISFQQANSSASSMDQEPDSEAIAQMKEMIYRAAVFRPVNLGVEVVEKPKRKNVRISSDPQTVAARQRRERISERIRVLQRLVPGGSKMDTASMLDEAANYLKFLRSQVKALESLGDKLDLVNCPTTTITTTPPPSLSFSSLPFNHSFPMQSHFPFRNAKPIHQPKC